MERYASELNHIAQTHGIEVSALQQLVNEVVERRIFDGERLDDLLAPLELGWRDRIHKETAIMSDLAPLLKRMVQGQEISGLNAYEE